MEDFTSTSDVSTRVPAPWCAAMTDLHHVHGFTPLRVEGRIPEDLSGTLFRNGPGTFSVPDGAGGRCRVGHWFDGVGAVSAVQFEGGRVRGAVQRMVPDGLAAEEAAGGVLRWGFGTPPTGVMGRLRRVSRNSANTSVMAWQQRLFALYEGNLPLELDPADLGTHGETDLAGVIPHTFSAHPQRVAARSTTYGFGVRWAVRPKLDVFALPDRGPASRLTTLDLDGIPLLHDFAATQRHLVFLVPPLRLNRWRQLVGLGTPAENLRWAPERGTEVIVVPIDAPEQTVRFRTDPFYQWHVVNAFEDRGETVVDIVRYPDHSSLLWLDGLLAGDPGFDPGGMVTRVRISTTDRRAIQEPLGDVRCEFPTVAPQVTGAQHQVAWMAAHTSGDAASRGPQDALLRHDFATGRQTVVQFGEQTFPSEPIVVPRKHAKSEDDAWLLSLVFDATRGESCVAVLDAMCPDAEPVARAYFDQPIPLTFHGTWLGGKA